MKFLSIILGLSLAVFTLASDVVELTDTDFASKMDDYGNALVAFTATWCGHCKSLKPNFAKAGSILKKNDPPIQLVNVDCGEAKATCEEFGIKGFPTLKIFKSGKFNGDYEGGRDVDSIVKTMKGQAGPSSKEISTMDEMKKFLADEDHSVVGFFETNSKLQDSFLKVADTERDRYRFAHTSNKEILEKSGFSDDIVVYAPEKFQNKFDPKEFKYDGNYDTDKIKHFLAHETTGLAGIRTQGNLFQFTQRPIFVAYYNVDYVKDPKGSNYWRNRVLKVAQDYKRKAFFAVSNKEEFTSEIASVGLSDRKDSDKPIVAALTKDGRFPMESEFSMDNLRTFIDQVLNGEAEPYMKSEPIPESQDTAVVQVVARNFKEVVTESDKDVLIEFYGDFCGHCKALIPIYKELAETLAEEEVVIAKIEATKNDVAPGYDVRGYPTIYWLPKNTKVPVPYSGGREVKEFIKFIAKHSTDGLKGYDRNGKVKKAEL